MAWARVQAAVLKIPVAIHLWPRHLPKAVAALRAQHAIAKDTSSVIHYHASKLAPRQRRQQGSHSNSVPDIAADHLDALSAVVRHEPLPASSAVTVNLAASAQKVYTAGSLLKHMLGTQQAQATKATRDDACAALCERGLRHHALRHSRSSNDPAALDRPGQGANAELFLVQAHSRRGLAQHRKHARGISRLNITRRPRNARELSSGAAQQACKRSAAARHTLHTVGTLRLNHNNTQMHASDATLLQQLQCAKKKCRLHGRAASTAKDKMEVPRDAGSQFLKAIDKRLN